MNYVWVKQLHIACVVLSVCLFVVRVTLDGMGRPWRQWRVLRIAPHLVDTFLLSSAVWLAWQLGQAPFVNAWLSAKVLALLAYIVLGKLTLTQSRPWTQRRVFFVLALLCIIYIVGVAHQHSPSWGLLR